MKLVLDLPCPRCGRKLILTEDKRSVSIKCPSCKLTAQLSLHEASRRAIRYVGGKLIFDWGVVIDELYFEMALDSSHGFG
ncbi:hypothetical protein [Vulcanisaeta thermophila]|uniref:hypothetical protein n=1 Tax=Vulcanisaeta thermophila TaxID=867917 RepID=UPI0008537B6C|nr:hypothetical protein [Vulcanisaeta thermophila]